MESEKQAQISPIVAESVAHNAKTLANFQSLTASITGVAAGVLGLESYYGFVFYVALTILSTALFYVVRVAPSSMTGGHGPLGTSRYFRSQFQFWTGGLSGGLAGFVLTWTLFYGLIQA